MEKKSIKNKLKFLLESAEELVTSESENMTDDLKELDVEKDCFNGGDIDDKNIIIRVKLF